VLDVEINIFSIFADSLVLAIAVISRGVGYTTRPGDF